MSVTFSPQILDPSAFVITCGCAPVTAAALRYDRYHVAAAIIRQMRTSNRSAEASFIVLPGCERPDHCSFIGPKVEAIYDDAGPDLNVNSRNAYLLLDVLGYGDDVAAGEYCGDADSEDFLGRVLTALAVAPDDAGLPCHDTDPQFTECGRHPGELQEQLHALHEIASWSRRNHRRVQWA